MKMMGVEIMKITKDFQILSSEFFFTFVFNSFKNTDIFINCNRKYLIRRQENPEIQTVEEFEEESRLSSSLLYCLDGNEPVNREYEKTGIPETELSFAQLTNRKRSLPIQDQENKENCQIIEENSTNKYSKKMFVEQGPESPEHISV